MKRSKDALEDMAMILEQRIKEFVKDIEGSCKYREHLNINTIEAFGKMSKYKDLEDSNHIKRVRLY